MFKTNLCKHYNSYEEWVAGTIIRQSEHSKECHPRAATVDESQWHPTYTGVSSGLYSVSTVLVQTASLLKLRPWPRYYWWTSICPCKYFHEWQKALYHLRIAKKHRWYDPGIHWQRTGERWLAHQNELWNLKYMFAHLWSPKFHPRQRSLS